MESFRRCCFQIREPLRPHFKPIDRQRREEILKEGEWKMENDQPETRFCLAAFGCEFVSKQDFSNVSDSFVVEFLIPTSGIEHVARDVVVDHYGNCERRCLFSKTKDYRRSFITEDGRLNFRKLRREDQNCVLLFKVKKCIGLKGLPENHREEGSFTYRRLADKLTPEFLTCEKCVQKDRCKHVPSILRFHWIYWKDEQSTSSESADSLDSDCAPTGDSESSPSPVIEGDRDISLFPEWEDGQMSDSDLLQDYPDTPLTCWDKPDNSSMAPDSQPEVPNGGPMNKRLRLLSFDLPDEEV